MKHLAKAAINSILSIALIAFIFPSVSYLDYATLVGAGLVLALLQIFVRPILKILLLPINIVTLGLFSWLINVLILWLVTMIVPGFEIQPTLFLGHQLGSTLTLVLISFMLGLSQAFIGIFIK